MQEIYDAYRCMRCAHSLGLLFKGYYKWVLQDSLHHQKHVVCFFLVGFDYRFKISYSPSPITLQSIHNYTTYMCTHTFNIPPIF
jgi:hypothetical protein